MGCLGGPGRNGDEGYAALLVGDRPVEAAQAHQLGSHPRRVDDGAVVDTARMRPELVRLRGLHGSVTDEERGIPFVTVPARTA